MPETPIAPQYFRFSVNDIDEYEQLSKHEGWNARCLQVSTGRQRWQVRGISSPAIYIGRENHGSASINLTGTPPAGLTTVILPLKIGRLLSYQGQAVIETDSIVPAPGAEVDFATEDGLDCLVIYLAEKDVETVTPGSEGLNHDVKSRGDLLRGPAIDALRGTLRALFWTDLVNGQPRIDLDGLRTYVVSQLAQAYADQDKSGATGGRRNGEGRSDYARKARDYMEANRHTPLSLADLCSEIGVSLRTLNYAFQEQCRVPPAKYHSLRRLNGARQDLKNGSPASTTVTQIAADWGFWHFGRFSQAYRSQFGELPSQTLSQRPARVVMTPLSARLIPGQKSRPQPRASVT